MQSTPPHRRRIALRTFSWVPTAEGRLAPTPSRSFMKARRRARSKRQSPVSANWRVDPLSKDQT